MNTPRKGHVQLDGMSVFVRFPYDKQRFQSIKRIREARYSKDRKGWILPVVKLPKLVDTKGFAPHEISYGFTLEQAEKAIAESTAKQSEIWDRVRQNPFSVSEQDIESVAPDVVVRLDRTKVGLRVFVKSHSPAKKIVTSFDQVHYVRSEAAYFLPVQDVVPLLKSLRDAQISFAVAKEAGAALQHSADARASIHSVDYPALAALRKSMVQPFLDIVDDAGIFALVGATSVTLKHLFPRVKAAAKRRSLAARLNQRQLIQLLHQASLSNITVWIPKEIQEYLESIVALAEVELHEGNSSFDDGLIYLLQPQVCFVHFDSLGFGLLAHKTLDLDCNQLGLASCNFPAYPSYIFFPFDEESFESTEEKLQDLVPQPIPIAQSYAEYRQELVRRARSLARRRHYLEQSDWKRWLSNSELEDRLFPHQRIAVAWLNENPIGMLGDDMGLGKTLSILACFDQLKRSSEADFILVVCPNSLVKNWLREVQEWIPNREFACLPETKRTREQFLNDKNSLQDVDGLVVNYESFRLPYVATPLKELVQTKKVMLVVDESQRVKNSQSKTFQALREIAPYCERRILLSGTPTPRDISDIWSQMFLIDLGERFGASYYRWLETVAELGTQWSEYAVKSFSPDGVKKTVSRVHEVLLRRSKEDVVKLPEKLFSVRDIELNGDQKKRFEEIRKELLLTVRSRNGDEFVREIESILEQYLRAVQVASNPRIIDPEWKGDPAKFVELDALVDELVAEQGRKMVVWTNYLTNIEELVERYKSFGAQGFSGKLSKSDRDSVISDFQSAAKDSIKILVAIPAAGGVGITLTAAQTAVYIDKTWNAEHWMQSIDRLHRIGQKGTVNIISLHASKVDEMIARNLYLKQKEQARVLGDKELIYKFSRPSREELIAAVN